MEALVAAIVEERGVESAAPHFVRRTWYGSFWSSDIAAGTLYPRTILGEPIVFFRTAGGVAALEDICPHRFAPLSHGYLDGDVLQCGYHGLRFDRAGACVYNPHGDHKIPPTAKARAYPVVEKHAMVWIWMGDDEPDLDAVPDYHQIDAADPVHVSKFDHIVLAADYRLITDNLLDLSHVPFLHPGALAGSVDDDLKVAQTGTTVTQTRWSHDVEVPSVFDMLFRNDGGRVDTWTEMHWRPAGCMILDTGVCDRGGTKASGTGYYGVHILTPETALTTHYYFTAVRFNVRPRSLAEDLELRERLSVARRFAFVEQDARMIEAQQLRVSAMHRRRPALLAVDAGAVRVQRVLETLSTAEALRS